MSLPRTYLMTPPAGAADPFGAGMSPRDLVRGLRQCNPGLCIPLPEHYDGWYPGKGAGQTCIWWGKPPTKVEKTDALKITSFWLDVIPEFTQLGAKGKIIRRGWRSILEKCIKSGAITAPQVERVFKIRLDYDGKDKLCPTCLRRGQRNKATGASGLCDMDEQVRKFTRIARAAKEEMQWQRRSL
jgi:hypothetical protein